MSQTNIFVKSVKTLCIGTLLLAAISCKIQPEKTESVEKDLVYQDVPFVQETHDAYLVGNNPDDNEVRSIAVDKESTVWIATASGIFKKTEGSRSWEPVISGDDRGPTYAVLVQENSSVLMGTWNGVYSFSDGLLTKSTGPKPPISVICSAGDETYALGPHGIWRQTADSWEEQP